MDKKIPIYFDVQVMNSPAQIISESAPELSRLKVAVFTKYGNRNGSYITDEVAQQLIESATTGNTPVVGFFDPGTQSWASHTGPTLANGYGYVESFLGWEPLTDEDQVVRDYAVFSVVLFTDYYEEARKIIGQHQSMELNPDSIAGDWAEINNEYYFVYTQAKMLGFCIIGNHEPCFSVSSFFSKDDDKYSTQFEKISTLLSDLKEKVDKIGGEQPMDNEELKEVVEETPAEEFALEEKAPVEEPAAPVDFEGQAPIEAEPEVQEVETSEQESEVKEEVVDWAAKFNELSTSFDNLQEKLKQITADFEALQNTNKELQTRLDVYAAQEQEYLNEKKQDLVKNYQKLLGEEEISVIQDKINDLSYEELESKLAVTFANQKMSQLEEAPVETKVPLQEPEESQFALFMKKYRKN